LSRQPRGTVRIETTTTRSDGATKTTTTTEPLISLAQRAVQAVGRR
jgi:hypothetical protein